MCKKISCLILLAFLPAAPSFAATALNTDNFSGYYANVGIGLNVNSIQSQPDRQVYYNIGLGNPRGFLNFPDTSSSASSAPFAMQLQAGWGKLLKHKYYLGASVGLQSASFDKNTSRSATDTTSVVGADYSNTGTASNSLTVIQSSPSYTLSTKFGYLLSPKIMLWGELGLQYSSLKLSGSNNSHGVITDSTGAISTTDVTARFNNTANSLGITYGLGIDYALSSRWRASISDILTDYADVRSKGTGTNTITTKLPNIPQFSSATTSSLNETMSLSSQNIMLSATYRF